jgi:hypothetical protein
MKGGTMSGGYVSCGVFIGDDKSCSALSGVIEQIEELPSYRADGSSGEFLTRIKTFLSIGGDPEWTDYLLIAPPQAAALKPYLEECKETLIAELGTADPFDAIEEDSAVRGLDPLEAQWGKGKGWRLYCVTDLLRAIEHCELSGDVICLTFD